MWLDNTLALTFASVVACRSRFPPHPTQNQLTASDVWVATAIFIASDKTWNGVQLTQLLDATRVS